MRYRPCPRLGGPNATHVFPRQPQSFHRDIQGERVEARERFSPPGPNRPKTRGPVRPGVVLKVSPDYAIVAMFTTLGGKTLSEIKDLLRPIVAAILPSTTIAAPQPSAGFTRPQFTQHGASQGPRNTPSASA